MIISIPMVTQKEIFYDGKHLLGKQDQFLNLKGCELLVIKLVFHAQGKLKFMPSG